jgi:hypothetical protein
MATVLLLSSKIAQVVHEHVSMRKPLLGSVRHFQHVRLKQRVPVVAHVEHRVRTAGKPFVDRDQLPVPWV